MPNQQLAQELQKVIINKFEKRKVYWSLKDNISGVDLADMHLVSKFNKGFFFFGYVLLIFIANTHLLFL